MLKARLPKSLSADTVFIALVIGSIIVLGVPRLGMSTFWDETKVYFKPLFHLYADFFGHLREPLTLFHRPIGLHFLYLPFLWITGPHLEVVRILNLLYFSLGLFFFYRICAMENVFRARLALLFVAITPAIQVYSVQYVAEPQLFALVSFYVYVLSFHPEKRKSIFFLGIYLGLVRETSLAVIPASMVFLYLRDVPIRESWKFTLGPLVGFLLYLLSTYLNTGEFFHHATIARGDIDLLRSPDFRLINFWKNFLTPFRLLFLSVVSMLTLLATFRSYRLSPMGGFSLVITLGYVFVFSGHELAMPRYYLVAFPFAVYFFLTPLAIIKRQWLGAFLVLIPPVMIGNPNQSGHNVFYARTGYAETWDYEKILDIHERAIARIKAGYKDGATIMTSWPFLEILKCSWCGYGEAKNYNLVLKGAPDAILFTDKPLQIDPEELTAALKTGSFSETIYQFDKYQIWLYEKKVNP